VGVVVREDLCLALVVLEERVVVVVHAQEELEVLVAQQ
jgi:hypothetical protein